MNKKINNFRPRQKVWTVDKNTGAILEGHIDDIYCAPSHKFRVKPLQTRTEIPCVWNDGTVGVINYKELKPVKR